MSHQNIFWDYIPIYSFPPPLVPAPLVVAPRINNLPTYHITKPKVISTPMLESQGTTNEDPKRLLFSLSHCANVKARSSLTVVRNLANLWLGIVMISCILPRLCMWKIWVLFWSHYELPVENTRFSVVHGGVGCFYVDFRKADSQMHFPFVVKPVNLHYRLHTGSSCQVRVLFQWTYLVLAHSVHCFDINIATATQQIKSPEHPGTASLL